MFSPLCFNRSETTEEPVKLISKKSHIDIKNKRRRHNTETPIASLYPLRQKSNSYNKYYPWCGDVFIYVFVVVKLKKLLNTLFKS